MRPSDARTVVGVATPQPPALTCGGVRFPADVFYRPRTVPAGEETLVMQGYVVRKGNQHYAVIYEGLDPLTGRERRRWHPAGADRGEAERIASKLAADWVRDRSPRRSGITVAVYLMQRWLAANQARLKPSTWAGYARNAHLHVIPRIGRVPLRHLRPDHIERMYADLAVAGNHVRPGGLDEKTIVEIHQMLRRALGDAARRVPGSMPAAAVAPQAFLYPPPLPLQSVARRSDEGQHNLGL